MISWIAFVCCSEHRTVSETGLFSIERSRSRLEVESAHGLTPKVHAEALAHIDGTTLAGDVGATSPDQLLYSTAEDIDALIHADFVSVLLS